MAALLFRLAQVPEDEHQDIRQLLDEGGFDIYETSAGLFGLGVAAIWLRDRDQLSQAQAVIDDYQKQRAQKMQADYQARVASGEEANFWEYSIHHPFRLLGVIAVVALVLAVMLLPFWKTLHL
jgi:hypothetical protein